MRLGARSPQRASVVVSGNVLVQELAAVGLFDAAVHPEFRFDVRKRSLKGVVRVWNAEVWIVIERPQIWHVAFQTQVCASECLVCEVCLPGGLPGAFSKECPPFFMPSLKPADEVLLAAAGQAVGQVKQFPGRLQFRVVCQIGADDSLLMDLAHLHAVSRQGLEQTAQSVAHDTVYGEPMPLQPFHTFQIVGDCLMPDILVPKDLVAQRILDDHQPIVAAPICRVHLDNHVLVFGYRAHMAHLTQFSLYRAYTFAVFYRQFSQGELVLDIVRYDVIGYQTVAANKTAAALITFIKLTTIALAILNNMD